MEIFQPNLARTYLSQFPVHPEILVKKFPPVPKWRLFFKNWSFFEIYNALLLMTSCSKDENGVLFFFIFGPEKDRFYVAAATTGAGVQSDCLQPRRMPSDACAQCG